MRFLNVACYKWNSQDFFSFKVTWKGNERSVCEICRLLSEQSNPPLNQISEIIERRDGHFSAFLENDTYCLAIVDIVRSYPIFYTQTQGETHGSNSARDLFKQMKNPSIDDLSVGEFRRAGYVTGRETIYKDLFQVLPGEALFFEKITKELSRIRYFTYLPKEPTEFDENDAIGKLDPLLNRVFKKVLTQAAGRPIWLPLSGGWDSRLILCKLHELGYDNLYSYSYGPKGNYEALAAEKIAKKLNIPWYNQTSAGRRGHRLFRANVRKEYWAFADGLSSIPWMDSFESLLILRKKKLIQDNATIINGHSGDFVSGGHIVESIIQDNSTVNDVLDYIISKHYTLWDHMEGYDYLPSIREKILDLIHLNVEDNCSPYQLAAKYELWEWQERQCKHIVNAQRLYDFLGYDWSLPLWEKEFVDFWRYVPLRFRHGQRLFEKYLNAYDYHGLFKGGKSESRRYYGIAEKIVPRILNTTHRYLGSRAFAYAQKLSAYFGHYKNLYALYGFLYFIRRIHLAHVPPQGRGFVAFNTDLWLRENNIATIPS